MPRLTAEQRKDYSKSTAIEYLKRIETVRSLLLTGLDTDAIIQTVTSQWNVKARMVYKYIAVAREKNKAYIDFHEAEMFSEHIAIRRHIRKLAIGAGDFASALRAAADEAKLMGLYRPMKIDVDMKWKDKAKELGYNPDDVAREIREFISKMQSNLSIATSEQPATIDGVAVDVTETIDAEQ